MGTYSPPIYTTIADAFEILNINGISTVATIGKKPIAGWAEFQTQLPDYEVNKADYSSGSAADGIGVICGKVSGNLICLDFDMKLNPAQGEALVNDLISDFEFVSIFQGETPYIEKTPSGGFHIAFQVDFEPPGSYVLLFWREYGKTAVEVISDKKYFVCYPSKNYTWLAGDLTRLPRLEEKNYTDLVELILRVFSGGCTTKKTTEKAKNEPYNYNGKEYISQQVDFMKNSYAVEFVNFDVELMRKTLMEAGWQLAKKNPEHERWRKPGGSENRDHARLFFDSKTNVPLFQAFTTETEFEIDRRYTVFEVLVELKFKKDIVSAYFFAVEEYLTERNNMLMRVVFIKDDAFILNMIEDPRHGVTTFEFEPFKMTSLAIQHIDKKRIPTLLGFANDPCFDNYRRIIKGKYNLSSPLPYQPKEGKCELSLKMCEHIFGEQLNIGLQWIKNLIFNPKEHLQVLVLASQEQGTGKSTFINWMTLLLGSNAIILNPSLYASDFNAAYISKVLVCFEEALFENQSLIEKMKAEVTAEKLTINAKFQSPSMINVFLHFILATNNVDNFAKIDAMEERFWVRKIKPPVYQIDTLLDQLLEEAPAFLYYLKNLPPIPRRGRWVVYAEETIWTKKVKEQSLGGPATLIIDWITTYFEENPTAEVVRMSAADFKEVIPDFHNYTHPSIAKILTNRVIPYIGKQFASQLDAERAFYTDYRGLPKRGKYFTFRRDGFIKVEPAEQKENLPPGLSDTLPF